MSGITGFKPELEAIHAQMNKEIHFKAARFDELVSLPMNNLDRNFCPALVLAVGKTVGKVDGKSRSLAAIFQYIFMADRIHRLIKDEDMPEHARQYPVLVGDFLFGQTFLKLCEEDLYPYTKYFIDLIETMNEGVLKRWRLKNKKISINDYRLILGKERASLTALAGRLAADLAGIEGSFLKKFEEYGYYLGMAWGFWDESLAFTLINEYLNKTKNLIMELKDFFQVEPLQVLYEYLLSCFGPEAKPARQKAEVI